MDRFAEGAEDGVGRFTSLRAGINFLYHHKVLVNECHLTCHQ